MKKMDLPDFDTLVNMHQEDPEAFEQMRVRLTEQALDDAPDALKRRLHGLQFRINMELRRAGNPVAACIKLSSMMHDSFSALNACLQNPWQAMDQQQSCQTDSAPAEKKSARVIPLHSFSSSRHH